MIAREMTVICDWPRTALELVIYQDFKQEAKKDP
jgi:hypothetical protein